MTASLEHGSCLLVLDFDGVIADSEALANRVLAEVVSELGVPTTLEEAYGRYMGKRFPEVVSEVERVTGRALPNGFAERLQTRTLATFRQELRAVEGAKDYIDAFVHVPKCIASSSSPDRLGLCVDLLGLRAAFGPHVYSAALVARGKPHPDLFLHAAQEMGVAPSRSIVIEDSVSGVQAGIAAGMTVVGLLAASHIQSGHRARLQAAGAHHVAETFADAMAVTSEILANLPTR